MPRGTYLHLDEEVDERFHCAPGAGGWRYVSERADGLGTDLTVDARWRQIRVQLSSGDLLVRGGVSGREALWIRGGEERAAESAGFLGESPAFLVAVARSLRLEPGAHKEVKLVRLSGAALAALTVTQRWLLADVTGYETETEPLPVERYEVTDLSTAEIGTVHLAGDIVLEAPGIELTNLESPPSLSTR